MPSARGGVVWRCRRRLVSGRCVSCHYFGYDSRERYRRLQTQGFVDRTVLNGRRHAGVTGRLRASGLARRKEPRPGFELGVSSLPRTCFTEEAFGPESGYRCRKRPLCVLLISLLATLLIKELGIQPCMSSVGTGNRQTCSGEGCPARHIIILRGSAVHTCGPLHRVGEYHVRSDMLW